MSKRLGDAVQGEIRPHANTLGELLEQQVNVLGGREFLRVPDANSYRAVSFDEFGQLANEMRRGLWSGNVRPGDRVAFLSPNRPEFMACAMGGWRLGCSVVPLSTRAPLSVLEHMLSISKASALVVSAGPFLDMARALKATRPDLKVFVLDDLTEDELQPDEMSLINAGANAAPETVAVSPEELALILFTSGTTKMPKGVPLSHRNILYNREASRLAWQDSYTDETLSLGWLPFFHVMGIAFEFLGALYVGARYSFPRLRPGPPTPSQLVTAVQETEADVFYTVPSMLADIRRLADRETDVMDTLRKLQFIMSGGAPLPEEVGTYLRSQGVNVIQGEGMTEVAGAIFLGNPKQDDAQTMQLLPGMNAEFEAVEGLQGKELILNNCPAVTTGYLDNEEANEKAFQQPGRLGSGDLFQSVPKGYVFVGRTDDLIVHTTGEKTNPFPIEQALEQHSAVAKAAIVGHHRPHALALLKPDYDALHGKQFMEIEPLLWQAIQGVNKDLESFSQLRRHFLIVLGPHERLAVNPKGGLLRSDIEKTFGNRIDAAVNLRQRRLKAREAVARHSRAVGERTLGLRDLVKRTTHRDYVLACIDELHGTRKVILDGNRLNLPQIVAVGRGLCPASLVDSENERQRIASSVAWLDKRLAEGASFYGITAGFGGSRYLKTRNTEALQNELIRFLNVGFGERLSDEIVRTAILVRVNSNFKGYSAIRWECLENLLALINKGVVPVVPRRGSISASGDLVPLAHIVGVLIGRNGAKATYRGQEISGPEALKIAGLKPIILQAKEGLALVNGTSVANAAAAIAMYHANLLGLLAQACTALSVEALQGTDQSYDPLIHQLKPHPGQQEVATNLLHLLQNSQLSRNERDPQIAANGIEQDRYSLRTAPQWLGPQLEVLLAASERVTTEANSATDNPLIDVKHGRALHGGNFQGSALTVAMEHTRLALEAIGQLLFAQYGQMVNKDLSNGLTPNLSGSNELATDYGLKGAEIAMASMKSELGYLASPVQSHVKSAELHNQDVNSLALISAMYTLDAVQLLQQMTAHHLYACMQAIDLRFIERGLMRAAEQAIAVAVEKSVPTGIPNAAELVPRFKQSLIGRFESETPLQIASHSSAGYGLVADAMLGAVSEVLHGISDDKGGLAAVLEKMRFALAEELDNRLPQAKETALQQGAADLLGNTRPLYEFIRRDLGIRFNLGDTEPGGQIEVIYEAIRDGRIARPLQFALHEMA